MLLSSLLSSHPSTPPPPQRTPSPSENPDLTRLHHTHHTHGYLAGITAGKALHVQSGFDEGYALGARFGLKIGWVLGVLQGLLHLHTGPSRGGGGGGGGGRVVKGELEKAKVELSFGQVFTREYFGGGGVWLYALSSAEQEGGEGVTLDRVVEMHPVVRKWVLRVKELAREVGVPVEELELEVEGEGEKGKGGDDSSVKEN